MTNGMAAQIPELPQGFVQGLTYLASFIEGSSADRDPEPGAFSFDVSRLTIPTGAALTVTANYTGSGAPGGEPGEAPDITSIEKTAAGITISWTGSGTVQSAPTVLGPWTDEPTTGSSFTTSTAEPRQFFRLQAGESGPATTSPVLTSPFSNALEIR
jgi:hypothetical protein